MLSSSPCQRAEAFSIPAPATILQDPYAKPKLLNHQSYLFFLCFICIINSNFPLAIFICHRSILSCTCWHQSTSVNHLWFPPVIKTVTCQSSSSPWTEENYEAARAQKRNHANFSCFFIMNSVSSSGSAEHCIDRQAHRHKHNHKIPTRGVTDQPEVVTAVATSWGLDNPFGWPKV